MKKHYLFAVIGMAMAAAAQADHDVFEFGVGHSFVDLDWDSQRQLDDDRVRLLTMAYHTKSEWSAEFFYADQDSKSSDLGLAVDGNQIGLKGLYHVADRHSMVVPYWGLGITELQLDGGAYDQFRETGLMYIAGLKLKITDHVALRLEADFEHFEKTHDNDTLFWAGFSVSFGARKAATSAPVVAKSEPVPEVAAPPTPVAPPALPPPVDSDGDGVVDGNDACPSTPAGLSVAADGCATLTEKASVALNVVFDSGKTDLKNADEAINRVVSFMNQYPHTKAVIEGHTDASGDDKKNKVLSQRRAEAVVAAMVKAGIAAERVSAVGFGEEKPLADNATVAGRAQNRRVTAEIEEQVVSKK